MWELLKWKDNQAVIDEYGESLTYGELQEASVELDHAIGDRCLVFILCRNCIGSLVGYVSCVNGRAVPLLLNAHMDRSLLEQLILRYRPSYLWMPEEDAASFEKYPKACQAFGYCLLETGFGAAYPMHEDLALLLTTSGSTGSPKFVRQSYANIRANTDSIVEYLRLDETERPITVLPMHYTYGLSILNTHLAVGATILMTDKGIMQKEFWEFFRGQGATSLSGVPYTYEMLDRLRFSRMELPSLRTLTQAGGKLLPSLHEKFARYAKEQGKNFVVMYGQCEATARMAYLPPEMALEKKGSMGIAIPGGKLKLLDASGHEIQSAYTPGELVYEGKNVTLGYAQKGEDLILGDERHGILPTGDMAQFDEDGYFYIVGRKKRFLKIYGNRVNLDEVDRMVMDEFGIEAASSGRDDHLCLFLTDGNIAGAVRDFVISKTKLNPAAFRTVLVEEIPKNEAGKVQYQELDALVNWGDRNGAR